jgi:hypothetical protein
MKKSISFGFRKITFSGRHEKIDFLVSEKSLFQGAMEKRFFRFSKNRFIIAA